LAKDRAGLRSMDRDEKCKAKAHARKATLDPVIAVHEAGHAIARFLAIGGLGGYSEDAAIAYIEVHTDLARAPGRDSFEKKATLHSQAITYGPRFPKQVSDAVLRLNSATDVTLDELTAIFAKARDDGVDIDKWLRAKLFEIVSGPMAEAIFSRQNFWKIWDSCGAEEDLRAAIENCLLAGIGSDEIQLWLDEAAKRSLETFRRPEVWRATRALANSLPVNGRVDGKLAVGIIRSAMTGAAI
jgi:hypothetical protein